MKLALRRKKSNVRASRVRGPSFFNEVLERLGDTSLKSFFLGNSEATEAQFLQVLEERFPRTLVAGSFAPPFEPLSPNYIEGCVEAVRHSGADIVWIGLGTPKQDFVAQAIAERLHLPCIGVGAAFDFLSGNVKEAPPHIQRIGLEWMYRLVREPRRLWRRYTVGNVQFLAAVAADHFRNRSADTPPGRAK